MTKRQDDGGLIRCDRHTDATPCPSYSVARQRVIFPDKSTAGWHENCIRHLYRTDMGALAGTWKRGSAGMLETIQRAYLEEVEMPPGSEAVTNPPANSGIHPGACQHCGTAFSQKATGRPARFCSTRCRVAAHRAAKR